jgi:transcriptional regulator BetI-like protein
VTKKKDDRHRAPKAAAPEASPVEQLDARGLPLVAEIARVAGRPDTPAAKLEAALGVLFAAYGATDRGFSDALIAGWLRARDDKQCRLTLAWHREQIRLSLEEILAEGVTHGVFRPDLDPGAAAAVLLNAAEGCLLHAPTEGGTVSPAEVAQAAFALVLSGA